MSQLCWDSIAPSLLSWNRCFHDLEKTCNIITLQKVEMLREIAHHVVVGSGKSKDLAFSWWCHDEQQIETNQNRNWSSIWKRSRNHTVCNLLCDPSAIPSLIWYYILWLWKYLGFAAKTSAWLSQAMTVTWWLFALGVMEYDAYLPILPILPILIIFFASIW